MPSRDELIAIVDVTPTTIRAGLGVHELIRGPLVVRRTSLICYPARLGGSTRLTQGRPAGFC